MIVYRSGERTASPARWIARIERHLRRLLAVARAEHDEIRELLIELGALEAAVTDALHPEFDDAPGRGAPFHEATVRAAHALRLSWDGASAAQIAAALGDAAEQVRALPAALPAAVRASVPEGFAYYGLHPEGYVEAGRRLARDHRPRRAVCIGIRSIGATLGAAARAGLEGEGCIVRSYTVRPRGHPFARRLELSDALRAELRAIPDALWVVADEGPGLSGSSFAAVSSALAELGISEDRVVLLPSWAPDGARFVSDLARARWRRHRKVVVSFDEMFIDSGRLARALGDGEALVDISAGEWRRFWFAHARDWPATQPQHERRKYLAVPEALADSVRAGAPGALARAAREGARVVKFVGLGRFGRQARDRAIRLSRGGWSPAPLALAHGFLASELVAGAPLSASAISPRVVDRVAAYVAFVAREFRTGACARRDELLHMMQCNVGELLGAEHAAALRRVARLAGALPDTPAVALDARMSPHEWVCAGRSILKTDATDHHDDHFYPGAQDPAWDLAAAGVELALAPMERAALVARYRDCSGDARIAERVPFHRVAYLAHRAAYAALAADSLSGTEEGERWRPVARHYAALLRRAIARARHAA